MDWDINNPYCFKTWTTLKIIGQVHYTFPESKNILMKNLSCWQQGINEQQLKNNIERTAKKFDEIIRTVKGITYNNLKQEEVRSRIKEFLSVPENSITDFAELISELYKIEELPKV